jgi:peptide/nickel transport system permease protein
MAVSVVRSVTGHRSALIGSIILIVLVTIAIFADAIAPYDPLEQDILNALAPPSWAHPMGTDGVGRDVLSRIIVGSRISLSAGIIVVSISSVIGVALGLIAGYFEGIFDIIISRSIDILLAFPSFLLSLAVLTILGPALVNALVAVAISSIPGYARVVRGTTITEKNRTYVTAARAAGCRSSRIMFRHILPNVLAPVVVLATLGTARAIFLTASLSFLGLGAQPPAPEWGAILSRGRAYMRKAWWLTLFPGGVITTTVLGLNLLGDGLRDILDPRVRRGDH